MKKIILLFILVLVFATGYQYISSPKQVVIPVPIFQVTETINYGNDKPSENFTQAINNDKTVFDVLNLTAKNIDSKQYDFGVMINSINDVKSGTDQKYWVYYVNDQSATIAADKYILKPNDKITWSFENLK